MKRLLEILNHWCLVALNNIRQDVSSTYFTIYTKCIKEHDILMVNISKLN